MDTGDALWKCWKHEVCCKSADECSGFCSIIRNQARGESLLDGEQRALRERCLEEIRKLLRDEDSRERATLVTGAGISIPARMPGWVQLVSKMLGSSLYAQLPYNESSDDPALRCRKTALLEEMMSGKFYLLGAVDPLESAQYLAHNLRESLHVGKDPLSVTRAMQSFIQPMIDKAERVPSGLAATELKLQSSLTATAYIMAQEKGFPRTLTYNYDTLLQEYMVEGFGYPIKSLRIYGDKFALPKEKAADAKYKKDIYHLHGCIPRSNDEKNTYGKLSNNLILSEDSYIDVEKHGAYGWFSSIQSYYLNYGPCVFVGFSGTDYNFKRILRQREYGRKQKSAMDKHYMILTIDETYSDIYKNVCQYRKKGPGYEEDKIVEEAKVILNMILRSRAEYWKGYGFYPIWVSVSEIPGILVSLVDGEPDDPSTKK